MGRTGTLYASEQLGASPDIILTGKSVAGGLPLTAVTGRSELMDAPHPGGLGGTYGGNPVACKAALAVLDILQGGILETAQGLGKKVHERFASMEERFELIGDARGLGPMAGLELVKDRGTKEPASEEAGEVVKRAFEEGARDAPLRPPTITSCES